MKLMKCSAEKVQEKKSTRIQGDQSMRDTKKGPERKIF